ncbi:related to microfibril-associated protein [Phialocephala subalpina]|uniref:Pre-mRNA-splicing factor n=1 Tax=Phialocephala subalpina TaxID=576137 RepID=A0A1L7XQY5_9HELO|nr:related to microfibril-associated protein [Phialocephala subalpina]
MSPSKDDPPAPAKIAIKGFSLSSKNGSSKPKPAPPSRLGKRPRSTFAQHDDSGSDSDDNHRRYGKVETVHGFADGGAIKHKDEDRREKTGPLVIPKQANRDWKAEARGRRSGVVQRGSARNLLPPEVQAAQEAARREANGEKKEGVDVVNSNDGEIEWGLSVRKRVKVDDEVAHEENGESEHRENGDVNGEASQKAEVEKPKTADEEALAALLGQDKARKRPDLVIGPANPDFAPPPPMSETDAYRHAISQAPDPSTLEDYERVPVEEFGAALLRGMGWKGESHGKVKDVKRRQNLLGLGAKELKEAEELGAWVHKSDVKRLNPGGSGGRGGGGGSGRGGGERRPKASEYKREEERRKEKREERGGGSYRRDKERERDGYRDSGRDSGRDYRDRDRDRDRRR